MTKKNFYVATAIPYVNGKPHLGHAILHLYADVIARYKRMQNFNVFCNTLFPQLSFCSFCFWQVDCFNSHANFFARQWCGTGGKAAARAC